MVVGVEESQWFLLQDQKHRVQQLQVFCEVVQVVQHKQWLRPPSGAADTVVQAVLPERGDELLSEQEKQTSRNGCEVEVVDDEEIVQLHGGSVAHDLATTEDDQVVSRNEGSRFLEGRHGSLALDEAEVVGRVSHDHGVDTIKNRPWVQFDHRRSDKGHLAGLGQRGRIGDEARRRIVGGIDKVHGWKEEMLATK